MSTLASSEDATLAEKVNQPELVMVPVYEGYVFFYTQSQSKRAWGTFVTPVKESIGQEYDNTFLKLLIYPHPQSEEGVAPQVPVMLFLTEDENEYVNYLYTLKQQHNEVLQEVPFKNSYLNDPFSVNVGNYQREAFKRTYPKGVKFVYATFAVDSLTAPTKTFLTIRVQKN